MDATLTLTIPEAPMIVDVRFDRWDGDRPQFGWSITTDGGSQDGTDLRLGSGSEPSLGDALRCLLDFFAAFAESVEYEHRSGAESSSNGDLFDRSLRELALALGSDTISMLARDAIRIADDA